MEETEHYYNEAHEQNVDCLEKNPAVEKHYSEMTKEQRLAELDSCIESIEKILDNYLKERAKILKG